MNKTAIKGVYIRFLARSSAKVGTFSLSPLEQKDSDLICSVSQLRYNVNKTDIKGVYIRFLASSSVKVGTFTLSPLESMLFIMLKWSTTKETEIFDLTMTQIYDCIGQLFFFLSPCFFKKAKGIL